jgi:hypothetical protein
MGAPMSEQLPQMEDVVPPFPIRRYRLPCRQLFRRRGWRCSKWPEALTFSTRCHTRDLVQLSELGPSPSGAEPLTCKASFSRTRGDATVCLNPSATAPPPLARRDLPPVVVLRPPAAQVLTAINHLQIPPKSASARFRPLLVLHD